MNSSFPTHSHRAAMLAVMRGATLPGVLFVPRLDIWHNRNRARGTLPAGFENLTLREVCRRLGVGLHSVIPDFLRTAPVEDLYHRALGFYNNPSFPYRVDFGDVDFEVEQSAEELQVRYHVAGRVLVTRCAFGAALERSGVSIPDVLEHAVKEPSDYAALAGLFDRVRIVPQAAGYEAYRAAVGEEGVAVAFLSLAGGPMQHILRDLRSFEAFCLDLYDIPGEVERLAQSLARLYDEMIAAVLPTSAEVAILGANYDLAITPPPFFEQHIAPWLNRAADRLHARGKLLLTHTDGENQGLLPAYQRCRFDIADSVCPVPMTRVTLREHRQAFGDRVTIWGGLPSVLMLKNSCGEAEFRAFVADLLRDLRPYDHFILSVADTLPPDADFDRLRYLCDVTRAVTSGR